MRALWVTPILLLFVTWTVLCNAEKSADGTSGSETCSRNDLKTIPHTQAEKSFRLGRPLSDVRIAGEVVLTHQVPNLQCLRCCFEGEVNMDHLAVASEVLLEDSEFESLVSVDHTRVHEAFDVQKVGFDKGLFISETEFGSNARLRADLVLNDLKLDNILVPGLLEMSGSLVGGETNVLNSTVNIVDLRSSEFRGQVTFSSNSHSGDTLLSGAILRRGLRFDLETLSGGIDLRHATIGTTEAPASAQGKVEKEEVSVQVENSYVGAAILLEGSNWSSETGTGAVLHVNDSTFDRIELEDWETFKRISQPPSGVYAFPGIEEKHWSDYFAFLRATEAGYQKNGYADLAMQADLYRIKFEAQRGGVWEIMRYWLLELSCKHGYQLWRIPVLWLLVIGSFAIRYMHYSSKFRDHSRVFARSQAMHRVHDFSEDVSCSFLSFFNLECNLSECYQLKKREHALALMHIERLVGVIVLFFSAALAGAYLSR